MNSDSSQPFLGITVLGDFILSEGVDAVIDNLHRVGATAVATNPTVTAAATEGTGSFQPPADAGSSPRVFDRPLFGKHALWVRSGVSYRPNPSFYTNVPYGPRSPNDLTEQHGHVIGDFIDAAVKSGLKVYLQIGAAQPTGLRDEDRPRLPSGEFPTSRMADTGSLASEAIRIYNRAYVRDLLATYPNITGFRPDWPEYPCYTLGEVFQDFSLHVKEWSAIHGFDYDQIRSGVQRLYDHLHGNLTNADLERALENATAENPMEVLDGHFEGVAEWQRLKQELSYDMLADWRDAIDRAGGGDKELSANAFMPNYTALTGFNFAKLPEVCNSVAPKLYTMHWSLMVKFWGDVLLQKNPELDERLLVRALVAFMDIGDNDQDRPLIADYGYPESHEPHPIPDAPQRRKIEQVRSEIGDRVALYPLVHGYGPPTDVGRRLQLVADSCADGVWINRYGYLGDEKLDIINSVWSSIGKS